jgi:hypothetical protein
MEETVMEFNQTEIKKLAGHKLLNDWEKGFIESVLGQLEKGFKLSYNQERIIKRCSDKTSEDEVKKVEDWESSFDTEKRRIFDICVRYYKQAGYFSHVVDKVAKNSDYIPNEKTFVKMCENKYAKKVLALCDSEPVWPVGGIATLRKTLKHSDLRHHGEQSSMSLNARKLKDKPVMILGISDELDTHRYYHVAMFMDPSINFDIREDKMKRHKS